MNPKGQQIYRHIKNQKDYEVIYLAEDKTNDLPYIVYKECGVIGHVYVRSLDDFLSKFEEVLE